MKTTHGTKAVKDQDDEEHDHKENEHAQDDDSDHDEIGHPLDGRYVAGLLNERKLDGALEFELRVALREACQREFSQHQPSTHSSWEELEREIIKQLGGSLQFYSSRYKRSPNVNAIVLNFLERAKEDEGLIQ